MVDCVCRVDFFIPGVETVGGFSMCSSPGLLQREGVVELAVKYTKHPPAHWIHSAVSRPRWTENARGGRGGVLSLGKVLNLRY